MRASPQQRRPELLLRARRERAREAAAPARRQTLNNAKLCNALSDIAAEHGLEGGCSREVGALLIMVATKFPATALRHRGLLVDYIKEGKISRNDQCTAALRHLAAVGGAELDVEAFDAAAGVGVVVSPDDVRRAVAAVCDAHADEIAAQRYRFNITKLIQPVKRSDGMAWADAANITAALQERRLAMLGPMTDEDTAVANQPVPKPKKTKAATPTVRRCTRARCAVPAWMHTMMLFARRPARAWAVQRGTACVNCRARRR